MHVHYLPIATTLLSVVFAVELYRRYGSKRQSYHLLWWAIGVTTYGIGTLVESLITLNGWNEVLFRSWYIAGALMGGAPLAQGTVYLVLKQRTAHLLSAVLVVAILFGAVTVTLAPIDYTLVDPRLPQGKVITWTWVRLISPFINSYAFVFLVGGAVASAIRFYRRHEMRNRYIGNVLIAIGALLPGVGGGFSRAGFTEALYVGEFVGIILIYLGYRRCTRDPAPQTHPLRQRQDQPALVDGSA